MNQVIPQLVSGALLLIRSLSASFQNVPRYCLYGWQASAVFVGMSTPLVIARISRFTLIAAPVK